MEERIRQRLAANPRDVEALLAMGSLHARAGDMRAATLWFRTAINQAQVSPVPPALHGTLDQAVRYVEQAGRQFEAHLLASIGDAGRVPRVRQAIDLLTGKAQLFLQEPTMFYFPGLPQRAFYEREEFPWLAEVEAATPQMIAELQDRLAGGEDFRPYVETSKDRPAPNNPLRDDNSWGAHYFWQSGEVVEAHAAKAPATMAALEKAPIPFIAARSPMALWSVLKPGTHIQPHHGMLNTRLICHIPLISNPDCGLRVGAETRGWTPGKALIFDDSVEHEAWNRGRETRVILLFEIWRPEIGAEERAALTRLYEAIGEYGEAQSGGAL